MKYTKIIFKKSRRKNDTKLAAKATQPVHKIATQDAAQRILCNLPLFDCPQYPAWERFQISIVATVQAPLKFMKAEIIGLNYFYVIYFGQSPIDVKGL